MKIKCVSLETEREEFHADSHRIEALVTYNFLERFLGSHPKSETKFFVGSGPSFFDEKTDEEVSIGHLSILSGYVKLKEHQATLEKGKGKKDMA